ncbi:putative V-set and immunoglobulin domain-containing-like IGHV4OR15-8-like [Crotalus adamanteus]
MKTLVEILFLLSVFPGVFPNVQLSQPLFKTQTSGRSVKLDCTVSGVEVGGWYWGWNRKGPGKRLEWLGGIKSTNDGGEAYYNSRFNNRIVITRDASKNEFYLELRSPAAADSGVYFCARHRAL